MPSVMRRSPVGWALDTWAGANTDGISAGDAAASGVVECPTVVTKGDTEGTTEVGIDEDIAACYAVCVNTATLLKRDDECYIFTLLLSPFGKAGQQL